MDLLSSAFKILEAIQQSSNPRKFVNEFVSYDNKKKELKIFDTRHNITGNLYILSVGKAAVSMTEALLEMLKDNFDHGIIVIPHEYSFSNPKFEVYNSGHPLPDENGIMASKKILSFVENTTINDIIICLLSGGGSALLPYPEDDLTLKDKIKTTRLLLKCGAKIEEINTVRKHLSKIKGGKLAEKANGTLLTLVLSDVPAGSTTCIASGPTVADPTTFKDAFEILSKYNLLESIPKNVLNHIKKGENGLIEESPKQVDTVTRHI
ncbi:MAG TPA: glycerate-2-kinase family protein [Exilispira sp.]|nr:glycerate-2-kinase family protein [Exilispira sp.]